MLALKHSSLVLWQVGKAIFSFVVFPLNEAVLPVLVPNTVVSSLTVVDGSLAGDFPEYHSVSLV